MLNLPRVVNRFSRPLEKTERGALMRAEKSENVCDRALQISYKCVSVYFWQSFLVVISCNRYKLFIIFKHTFGTFGMLLPLKFLTYFTAL